jgi:tRNA A-37 threonylcarbamoyl transferase component Bud32
MLKKPFGLVIEVEDREETPRRDSESTPAMFESQDIEPLMRNIEERLFIGSAGQHSKASSVKTKLLRNAREVLGSYQQGEEFITDFFKKTIIKPDESYDEAERGDAIVNISTHTRTWGIDIHGRKLGVNGSVYKFEEEGTTRILKLYNYDCNTIIESKIILEIVFQKYAKELNESCGFYSPNVIRYGKIKLTQEKMTEMNFDRKCLFYIVMENMQGVSIKQLLKEYALFAVYCKQIKKRIKEIVECLIKNHLYHNDLNGGNLFVLNPADLENAQIGMIDFGEASISASDAVMVLFTCPKKAISGSMSQRTISVESNDSWLLPFDEYEEAAMEGKSVGNVFGLGLKRKKTMRKQHSLNQTNISKKIKYRESKKHRTSQINHKIKRSKKHHSKTLKKKNATHRPNNKRRSHSKKGMRRK